jgi:hypothetical protein
MLPFILAVIGQPPSPIYSFDLLQSTRTNITRFIPYSAAQKRNLAKGINSLFDIYPHTESKIANYGNDYPNIDPVPRAKAIGQKVEQLSDAQMHFQYSELFRSLRDFHTKYFFPAPHSCYDAFTAAKFQFIESNDIVNNPRIAVANFAKAVLPLSPDASKMAVGDELLTINGKSFVQIFKEQEFKNGGANLFGGYRGVLNQLSAVGGNSQPMPTADNVKYMLKSQNSGLEYMVVLPWVTRQNINCTTEAEPYLAKGAPETVKKFIEKKRPIAPQVPVTEYTFQLASDRLVYQKTADSKIRWTVFKPESQNMGIIRIDDFLPSTGDDNAVRLIFELLNNQLAATKSLLIDMRSNRGGSPKMATSIHQFFVSGFQGILKRVIMSPTNEELVVNQRSVGKDYSKAYIDTPPGAKYSNLVDVLSTEQANSLGQAYLKPVGVFTDANCYSACDVFSTNMKDGTAAIIFGEDGQTGSGGASASIYSTHLSPYSTLFPALPLGDHENIAPEMRVAHLQTLKNGINRGEISEDIGAVSDFIVRPRVEDIMVPDTMSQFERIAAKLNEVGIERGTAERMLLIKPLSEVDVMLGSFIDFKLKTQNIHSISIVSVGGEVLHSQVFDSTVLKETGLNIKTKETIAKRETLLFLGFNEKGENIFKGKRNVRLIPAKLYEIPTSETPVLFTENGVAVYSI